MTQSAPIIVKDPSNSRDNEIRPFSVEGMNVRGRAVRFGTVVDQILEVQKLPEPVARILGELVTIAAMLGSMLKHPGIVTVQTKARGPVPMMVADYEQLADGTTRLRAHAQVDDETLKQYGKNPSFHGLIGSKTGGYLALTIDQGEHAERYQGIVELTGDSLSDVAIRYFENSEQLPTRMRLACERDSVTGNWRAGGIMVQHMSRMEEGGQRLSREDIKEEERWQHAAIMMESVKDDEMLNPALDLDQLLFRLYHEDGVRVYEATHPVFGCRCSREKIEAVISGFSADDVEHMTVDGSITVSCHFCGTDHVFNPAAWPKRPAKESMN